MFRVGSVPYLNARPIVLGLDRDPAIAYCEEVPSRLAESLRQGELDAALVSSIEATRLPNTVILDAPCIASHGPVWSVRVIGSRDVTLARTVALDGSSRTAAALTKIVYREFLKRRDVEFVPVGSAPDPTRTGADATLVIGDAALQPDAPGSHSLDLGEAWTRATQLPFVWAVWLARADIDLDALAERLRAAGHAGVPRAAELARTTVGRIAIPEAIRVPYLTQIMRYRLGDTERLALDRFFALEATTSA